MQQEDKQELLPATVQAQQVAVTAPVAMTPMDMIAHAVQRNASVAEIEQLMNLADRLRAEQAKQAFIGAMAEFKRNPPRIEKTRTANITSRKEGVGSHSYKYANLADVCDKIVARLAECGISHDWSTKQHDGFVAVTCTLTHEQGHSKSTMLSSALDTSGSKNHLQALGSAVSYLNRYTLLAVCGVAVDDEQDDDGAASGPERDEMRGAAREMRQRATPANVAAGRGKQAVPTEDAITAARAAADKGHMALGAHLRSLDDKTRASLTGEMDDLAARAGAAAAHQDAK